MKRVACLAGFLAVLALSAGADEPKPQSIGQLMNRLHKGADAPGSRLNLALKEESPDWEEVRRASNELVVLGAGMPRAVPKRGDKANYLKLATAYYDTARALDDAARNEDTSQARSALARLGASCRGCHAAHKGR